MAYQSWSVVFGEQPSASKWGILGSNDASFNDGTGIFGLKKDLLATDSNPYKFRVYRNAAYSMGAGSITKFPFDAENFDTNNNFDSTTNYRYTAPVSGFYQFSTALASSATATRLLVMLYKNGSESARFWDSNGSAQQFLGGGSVLVQATASDYFEVYYFVGTTGGNTISTSASCWFSGFLVSRT